MRNQKQITKAFYRRAESGDIFCIEKRWDGVLLDSCGPLQKDELKDPDGYECTHKNNLWIQDVSDKLILMGSEE